MVRIGSNPASLAAQRRLADRAASGRKSAERLSSGLRINHASDDAAGLSIGTALRSDARLFAQGVRNLNEAVGTVGVAEAALSELTGAVIRLRELAVGAASGTFSPAQRTALDREAQALRAEYGRILAATDYNGLRLLDGSVAGLSLQAGVAGLDVSAGGEHLRQVGSGSFEPDQAVYIPAPVIPLGVADVNNDGHLDAIGHNSWAFGFDVLLGNGDGTFQPPATYSLPARTYLGGQILDLDSDGNQDIVFADASAGGIQVVLGNGDGTFGSATQYAGNGFGELALGDVNGDGRLDVTRTDGNTNDLFYSNGDGTFSASATLATGLSGVEKILFGDADDDGHVDAVARTGTGLYFLRGTGPNSFTPQALPGLGGEFSFEDIDGDGREDIVSNTGGGAQLFRGNGDGTFQAGQLTGLVGRLWFGDINGDGLKDALSVTYDGNDYGEISGYIARGDGTFRRADTVLTPYSLAPIEPPVFLGDFDEDGIPDVLTGEPTLGELATYRGLGGPSPTLEPLDLTTQASARLASNAMTRALERLGRATATWGAARARLEAAAAALFANQTTYDDAASRVMDADLAEEAAGYARDTLLTRAAAGVLSEVNLQPSLALRLLGTATDAPSGRGRTDPR